MKDYKIKMINVTILTGKTRKRRIKDLDRVTNKLLKNGITDDNKEQYLKLRKQLELLRGDWESVIDKPHLPSSELIFYRSSEGYKSEECDYFSCPNRPAGSADCIYYECP